MTWPATRTRYVSCGSPECHTWRSAYATGQGLVGPLVVPGVTSCLTCADLHRADRDSAWPAVAMQLRGVIGNADRPTVLATAALA